MYTAREILPKLFFISLLHECLECKGSIQVETEEEKQSAFICHEDYPCCLKPGDIQ